MRFKSLWMGGLVAALLGTAYVLAQTPEMQRSLGGRGGFNPADRNERFNQYSGGQEVWNRNDVRDEGQLRNFDRIAQQLNVTNGVISRQQYLDYYQQMGERFAGGTYSFTGAPGTTSTFTSAPGTAPTMTMPSSSGPGGRGRGGWGSAEGMASMSDSAFRRADRDGDGVLNNNEMSDALRNDRDRFDLNRDGVIDAAEYRNYMEARSQQFQTERANNPTLNSSPGNGPSRFSGRGSESAASFDPGALTSMTRGGNNSFTMTPSRSFDPGAFRPTNQAPMNQGGRSFPSFSSSSSRQPEPPSRPVVYKPGNLPSGLPAWFSQRDTDGDGQVGLYEWRASGQPLSDFQKLDANGDGFVTVEEVLRDQKGSGGTAVASNARDSGSSRNGNGPSGSRNERTPSGSADTRGAGAENVPFDRAQMMEMMARAREAMSQGGGPPSFDRAQMMEKMMKAREAMTPGDTGSADRGAATTPDWTSGNRDGNGSSGKGRNGPPGKGDGGGSNGSRKRTGG